VELLTRPAKLGLASAYQTALRRVLDEGLDDCIVTMDADFSHHPRFVPPLVAAAERHDARISELPIRFVESRFGHSKLSSNIVYEGLVEPWRIRRRPRP
jgi:hypothetical protein